MHRTLLSISALALLSTYTLVAAQEYIALPDTLFFDPPITPEHVLDLDSAGAVSTELDEVNTRLVELKGDRYGSRYALAFATNGGFDLLPISDGSSLDDVQLSTADVLGNGQLQVVVRTMHYMGHSGWEHAIHEREWAVEVWDLQRRQRILHLTTGQSMEEWTNYWTPDSTGLLSYEERTMLSSEGERSCETNDVLFQPREITVVPTDDCPDLDDQDDIPRTPRPTEHYVLRGGAWVKH